MATTLRERTAGESLLGKLDAIDGVEAKGAILDRLALATGRGCEVYYAVESAVVS